MKKLIISVLLLILLAWGSAQAQNLTGTYILAHQGVTLTLVFQQDAQGNLMGSLSSTTGQRYQIEGMIQDGVGVGACYDQTGAVFFEAHPQPGDQLLFALIEVGANNQPDLNNIKKLMFTRQGSAMPPVSPMPGQTPGQTPGQMPGQMPSQMPGMTPPGTQSTPGMTPGQMPSQMPSQMPGMTPTTPGQMPGQMPGQTPSQMPGMTPPGSPSSPGTTPGPGMPQAPAQERFLSGRYCNRGGEVMWAYFDGQGNFQYGTTAPEGYGTYRVQGNIVELVYPDGSYETVQIAQRASDGAITALQYEGQIFSPQLCQ